MCHNDKKESKTDWWELLRKSPQWHIYLLDYLLQFTVKQIRFWNAASFIIQQESFQPSGIFPAYPQSIIMNRYSLNQALRIKLSASESSKVLVLTISSIKLPRTSHRLKILSVGNCLVSRFFLQYLSSWFRLTLTHPATNKAKLGRRVVPCSRQTAPKVLLSRFIMPIF